MKDFNTDIVNAQLLELYNSKFPELIEEGNCSASFPILIKCPPHYCDDDNKRIMFIRTVPSKRRPSNFQSSIPERLAFYEQSVLDGFIHNRLCEDEIDTSFDSLNRELKEFMNGVNFKLNKGKKQNYIFSYIFKNSLYHILYENKELVRSALYKVNVEMLKQEISILKPHYIFFSDLDYISTFKNDIDNHSAKYDFFKELFTANTVLINTYSKYIDIYPIECDKLLNFECYQVNNLDVDKTFYVVKDYALQNINELKQLSVKTYKDASLTHLTKLSSIEIKDFHSYKNKTKIDINNNLLVLVGKNDIGKTSVLQALDMLQNKQVDIDNHISLIINNGIIDFKSIETHRFNYFWFKTETFSDNNIEDKTIKDLINFKRDNLWNRKQSAKLMIQINEILSIYKYLDRIMDYLNSKNVYDEDNQAFNKLKLLFDNFFKRRDLLVLLYGKCDGDEDFIKDYYNSCETDCIDIDNLRINIDYLYSIINQYNLTNRARFEDVRAWNKGGTPPPLLEILGPYYLSSEILDEEVGNEDGYLIYELQQYVKNLYFHGTDSVSVVDEMFLKLYDYDDLLLKGSPKDIVAKCNEIKDNLDNYISRKLDNTIIDKWIDLLSDFVSGDSVPICKRGAGVRRLCSLFNYIVDTYRDMSVHKYPTIIAIDEIELSLHPNQQRKFINLLKDLSKDFQFIITTHSPYIVNELNENNIAILKKDNLGNTIVESPSNRVLKYPSLAQINYIAFDEPSIEYHIELFGYMQNKLDKNVRELDEWLKTNGCNALYDWYNTKTLELMPVQMTLPYCVRNNIDHPLNDDLNDARKHAAFVNNNTFTDIQLIKASIEIMIDAISHHPNDFR